MKKRYILSFDAGGTFLKSGIFIADERLTMVENSIMSVAVDSNGAAEDVHNAYTKLLCMNKAFSEKAGFSIDCISVDTPGPFDYKNGMSLMTHKYTSIYKTPLRPWFYETFGQIPVYFMHDSFAFIYGAAEETGGGKGKNLAGVMIGTGLGFALLINGRVQMNSTGGPAKSIYREPYADSTAEEYVSARGITNRYNSARMENDRIAENAKDVAELAKNGNLTAIHVYLETGKIIAEVISEILNEYKIDELILGGQISKSYELFYKPLYDGLKQVKTLKKIRIANNIDDVHLIGAAAGVL